MTHKPPSQRQLRMGEQVRHALVDILLRGGFDDEALLDTSLLSINEVRMTPDLKNAKAYVSKLGAEDFTAELEALNNTAHQFQRELNRKLDSKFTPRVKFVADTSQEEVSRLEAIFHNLPKAEAQES